MITVLDERELLKKGNHHIGVCENCLLERNCRQVEAFDTFTMQSRGFYNICFYCESPMIYWKYSLGGKTFRSPAYRTYADKVDALQKSEAEAEQIKKEGAEQIQYDLPIPKI